MATDFNVYPYYDDYDSSKNFHRILFKPGVAVQARELTQSQSILQDQITKFGNHIFKNHSIVSGGQITSNFGVKYLKLQEFDRDNNAIDVNDFLDKTIKNFNGNVVAKVVHVIEKNVDSSGAIISPPILILSYFTAEEFNTGDLVYVVNETITAYVITDSSSFIPHSGSSSISSIDEGVFYVDGYFVEIPKQTTSIDVFSSAPSARVGLTITEEIISSDDDFSLLDPALGASNYQAPGADRYKISLTLTSKPIELDDDNTFIELTRIEGGVIKRFVVDPRYSEIDDYFAKRTLDTNGNFIVNKFKVSTEKNSTDANTFYVKIGPGKAYVNGYIAENQSDLKITSNKARTYETISQKEMVMNYGQYVYIENVQGQIDFNNYQQFDIHVTKSPNTTNNQIYSTTVAATGKIRNLKFQYAANTSNSKSYVYQAYMFDIQNNNLSATANGATANTITFPNYFSSETGVYSGIGLRINDGADEGDVLQIASYNGATRTATTNRDFIRTPENNCNFSLLFNTKDFESFYNNISANTVATISNSSKVNALDSGDVFLSNLGDEELIYKIGNPYVVKGSLTNSSYYSWIKLPNQTANSVMTIDSPTVMNFVPSDGTLSVANAEDNFIFYVINPASSGYQVGEIIPLDLNNTVTISDNSTKATLTGPNLTGVTVDVYAKVEIVNGNDLNSGVKKRKTLVSPTITSVGTISAANLVSGKANTYFDSTKGQVYIAKGEFSTNTIQSLYVSDVYSILKIVDTLDANTAANTAMINDPNNDVTRYYSFNNGQNDYYYDHASIKLLKNAPQPKGNILVLLSYFSHEGNGYLDLDSYTNIDYEILPTYVSRRGITYNLRDCVDFRRVRDNGTTAFTFTSAVTKQTGIPLDGTEFKTDYSYYLGRKDLLVIDKDRKFCLIEGVPALRPEDPNLPANALSIAKISHDPYTSNVPGDMIDPRFSSIKIETMTHKRWRMEDITSLEDRVSRVEYYTTLNALEQTAKNLQIPDEFGINRFKNGIITDDFSSYKVSDITSPDLKCSVQPIKNKLFSVHKVQNFDLAIKDTLNNFGRLTAAQKASLGYTIEYDGTDAYICLPYYKTPAATQPYATRTVNLNPFAFTTIDGDLRLNPSMDQWISTTRLPDRVIDVPIPQNTVNIVSVGDWQTIGTTVLPSTTVVTTPIKTETPAGQITNFNAMSNSQLQDFATVWDLTSLIPGGTITDSNRSLVITRLQPYSNKGVTYITTTTETTKTTTEYQKTDVYNEKAYNTSGTNYLAENGYVTDVSLNPYIRQQQIEFYGSMLAINSPVRCYFDGIDVTDRIRETNKIFVTTNSLTAFETGDILGYYSDGSSPIIYPGNFVICGKVAAVSRLEDTETETGIYNLQLDVIWDIDSEIYTTGTSNPYLSDIFSLSFDAQFGANLSSPEVKGMGTISSFVKNSGKILEKINNTSIRINKRFTANSNTYSYGICNILFDDVTYQYTIDYESKDPSSNTTILHFSDNIVTTDNIVGATYCIRKSKDYIYTDHQGKVSGVFYLPKDTFHTGEKIFRIDNKTNALNLGSETTFAEAKFFASSLTQKKENLNFAPDYGTVVKTFTRSENKYYDTIDVVTRIDSGNTPLTSITTTTPAPTTTRTPSPTTTTTPAPTPAPTTSLTPTPPPPVPPQPECPAYQIKGIDKVCVKATTGYDAPDYTSATTFYQGNLYQQFRIAWEHSFPSVNISRLGALIQNGEFYIWTDGGAGNDVDILEDCVPDTTTKFKDKYTQEPWATQMFGTGSLQQRTSNLSSLIFDKSKNPNLTGKIRYQWDTSKIYGKSISFKNLQIKTATFVSGYIPFELVADNSAFCVSTYYDGFFKPPIKDSAGWNSIKNKLLSELSEDRANQYLTFLDEHRPRANTGIMSNHRWDHWDMTDVNIACVYGDFYKSNYDPICQTFIFYADEYPNGCFIKSIKVFFRTKSSSLSVPVSCYIFGTKNGYPDGEVLPHAVATLTPDKIKVSETPHVLDENAYTEFEFPVPIYVKPETLYAFMLKTDTNEYTAYTAKIGDVAIPSSVKNNPTDPDPMDAFKISSTPYIGELFLSQNTITWGADQNQDLMFRIERCEFDISKNPLVEFVTPRFLPQRKLIDNAIENINNPEGLAANNVGFMTTEDYKLHALNITTTDLTFGDAKVVYSYKSSVYNDGAPYKETRDKIINPGKFGTATLEDIYLDDGLGERVLVANTTSSFSLYAYLSSRDSKLSPIISESGVTLYGIQWDINDLGISNNDIIVIDGGTGYDENPVVTVNRTSNNYIGNDAIVQAVTANGVITGVNVIYSGTQYASSPTITITDDNRSGNANAVIIVSGETEERGGNGVLRYITKPVVLAPGFDAGDLRIYYTAYRPLKTNIHVYYKILNRNDTQEFDDSDWQLMTTISGASTYSTTRDELYEYVAAPYIEPAINIASNKVSYVSKVNGTTYNTFYKFAIKVVMTSSDPTFIPFLKDIRGIALPEMV